MPFDRRQFLKAAAGAAACAFLPETLQVVKAMPQAASELGKVKITGVKTASVDIKYPAHLGEARDRLRSVRHRRGVQPRRHS